MNVSLTSGLGLLYTNVFTVSRESGFLNYDFQQLTLILGFEFIDKIFCRIFHIGNYKF